MDCWNHGINGVSERDSFVESRVYMHGKIENWNLENLVSVKITGTGDQDISVQVCDCFNTSHQLQSQSKSRSRFELRTQQPPDLTRGCGAKAAKCWKH